MHKDLQTSRSKKKVLLFVVKGWEFGDRMLFCCGLFFGFFYKYFYCFAKISVGIRLLFSSGNFTALQGVIILKNEIK